jgi:hypothetical protein
MAILSLSGEAQESCNIKTLSINKVKNNLPCSINHLSRHLQLKIFTCRIRSVRNAEVIKNCERGELVVANTHRQTVPIKKLFHIKEGVPPPSPTTSRCKVKAAKADPTMQECHFYWTFLPHPPPFLMHFNCEKQKVGGA